MLRRHPALGVCGGDILSAIEVLVSSFRSGHKLLACGNGGSAADCEHIVGELMKGISWRDALRIAADYTALTIEATLRNPKKPWYGVDFEATIPELLAM